jgi:hypothetical protein
MNKVIVGLALTALAATSALAEVKQGGTLYDLQGKRIGTISRVLEGGAISVIVKGRTVVVPAQSLNSAEGKVTTTLTRAQVRKL